MNFRNHPDWHDWFTLAGIMLFLAWATISLLTSCSGRSHASSAGQHVEKRK